MTKWIGQKTGLDKIVYRFCRFSFSWVLSCQKKQERLRSELSSVDEITNLLFFFTFSSYPFGSFTYYFFIKKLGNCLSNNNCNLSGLKNASIFKWEYWFRITAQIIQCKYVVDFYHNNKPKRINLNHIWMNEWVWIIYADLYQIEANQNWKGKEFAKSLFSFKLLWPEPFLKVEE